MWPWVYLKSNTSWFTLHPFKAGTSQNQTQEGFEMWEGYKILRTRFCRQGSGWMRFGQRKLFRAMNLDGISLSD